MKDLKIEKEYLDTVVKLIHTKIKKLEDDIRKYRPYIYAIGDDLNDWDFELKKSKALKVKSTHQPMVKQLNTLKKKPYFGKISLEKNETKEEYYIGQEDLRDEDNNQMVVSWLTEYGDLFYKRLPFEVLSNGDQVKVFSTRNFNIEESRLLDYKDYEILSGNENYVDLNQVFKKYISSEFLQNELINRNAQKLQPIFQTIDQIQNEVIRMNPAGTLVVQGVSGSGKTTMGLQRLSYIIYHFEKNYKKTPEILMLCPNNTFLDYIQELVPNLNLNQVSFKTVEEFFLDLLPHKIKISQKTTKEDLSYHFTHVLDSDKRNLYSEWFRFKGSQQYAQKLKLFLDNKKTRLYALDLDYIHPSLNNDYMNRIIRRAESLPFNDMLSRIISITEHSFKRIQNVKKDEIKKILSRFRREILSHKQNVEDTYREFLKEEYFFQDVDPNYILLNRQNRIYNEDIPALIYLSTLIEDPKLKSQYNHIFVDEGQDMNYMQFLILKNFNSSLTIVGDLNQQIYLQNGVGDWEKLRSLYNFKFIKLDYNYRSTKEIMDLATSCLIDSTFTGTGVLETGIKPIQYNFSPIETTLTNWGNIIMSFLAVWQSKNESIAIITNSISESEQIEQHLNNLGILNTNVIRSSDSILKNGDITIISTLQVKGLEFNHVLLYNPSEEEFPYNGYSSNLLYMAMTRALFSLVLVIIDPPTKLLDRAYSDDLLINS